MLRNNTWKIAITITIALSTVMATGCSEIQARSQDRNLALNSGLIFYLPLDGSLVPRVARGSKVVTAGKCGFEPGVRGQALACRHDAVRVYATGNYCRTLGSVAFWIKPDRDMGRGEGKGWRLFDGGNLALHYSPAKGVLFFMTGTVKPQVGFKWDYSVADYRHMSKWRPGTWHHVAATWDAEAGNKALYLDGVLVKAGSTEWMRRNEFAGQITLGSQQAPGSYDELMIWNRVLGAAEIAMLAANDERLADMLASLPVASRVRVKTPLEFELRKIKPPVKSIVAPGEVFAAQIPVRNITDVAIRKTLQFSLIDFWEKSLARRQVVIDLQPGAGTILQIGFTPPALGPYKIESRFEHNGITFVRDVACFAAWPLPVRKPDPDSYIGHHVNSWGNGRYLAQAARLGQGWMRDHDMLQLTRWDRVQPDPGKFAWTQDRILPYYRKFNMPILGQIFGTPYWAARGGAKPKPAKRVYPKNWAPDDGALREYVIATISRYKHYIKYWEIWNEPAVGVFWKGTPEEFGHMCQVVYKAAKETDPDCVLMPAGFTSPAWVWHERAARAGALKHCDAISFHFGCPLKPPEQTYGELLSIINHFQELAVKYGPGHKVPLWSTEGGTGTTTWLRGMDYPGLAPEGVRQPFNWREGSIRVVQGEAVQQCLGIVRHFQYLQNTVKPAAKAYYNTSMLEVTDAPKPVLMARTAMAAQLDFTSFTGMVRKADKGRFWANVYRKRNQQGAVVLCWVGDKGLVRLECDWPGKVIKLVDIMGNEHACGPVLEVGEEPLYLHVQAGAKDVIRALRASRISVVTPPIKLQVFTKKDGPKVPVLPDYVAPTEAPQRLFTVDLRKYCNFDFADSRSGDGKGGWSDEGPQNDMRDFPTGRQTWYGVPFDIIKPAANNGKAIIVLRGSSVTPGLPQSVSGILIERKVRVLYFLHAAAWGRAGTIGRYVVHYADGSRLAIPVTIPVNCHNWWNGYHDGKKGARASVPEVSRPVPIRVTNTNTGKPAWRYVRIFEWQNPKMGVPVTSVDVVSDNGPQTPILIAISGVGAK